jgi:hypothetical protein
MKRDTSSEEFTTISREVSPVSLLDVFSGYCQGALVDESGLLELRWGHNGRSEMVAVQGSPCASTP